MGVPKVAVLASCLLFVGPLGARCPGPPTGQSHPTLYLHVLPAGSSFVYPARTEIDEVVQDVADYFAEVSYGSYFLRGVEQPALGGDVAGPLFVPIPFTCDLEQDFAEQVVDSLIDSVDFGDYEHLVLVSPGLGCTLNGLDLEPFLRLVDADAGFCRALDRRSIPGDGHPTREGHALLAGRLAGALEPQVQRLVAGASAGSGR